MKILHKFAAGCLTAALIGSAFGIISNPASAKEFRMLSSWPETMVFTKEIAIAFKDILAKESGGKLTASLSGPEVIPPFEQLQPVQTGVFDILVSLPAYHIGTAALGVGLDGVTGSPAALRSSGLFDVVDAYYQKRDIKVLALVPTSTPGTVGHFMLKKPISGAMGLQGRKIRATPPMHAMVKALGGVPVVLKPGEVYGALEKGVVDGAFWAVNGTSSLKWNEVAGHMSRPTFGSIRLWVFMNLKTWNGLSADQKATVNKAAQKLENEGQRRFDDLAVAEEQSLAKLNVKKTFFIKAEADSLQTMWSSGLWGITEKLAGDEAKSLRAKAVAASMSN